MELAYGRNLTQYNYVKIQKKTNSESGNGNTGGSSSSGGSGGGSGSSSSPITVVAAGANQTGIPTMGTLRLTSAVDANKQTTLRITERNALELYQKAWDAATKKGSEANGVALAFRANTGSRQANGVSIHLSKAVQEVMINKGVVNTIFLSDNPAVRINLAAMRALNRQANGDVEIVIVPVDMQGLGKNAMDAIETRPVYAVSFTSADGRQLTDFGTGMVTLDLPYSLGEGEKAENICAVSVSDGDAVQWLVKSSYDAEKQKLRLALTQASVYGAGYRPVNTEFGDIAEHPAKNAVEFAVSHDLLAPSSGTEFAPNQAMTQEIMAAALGKIQMVDAGIYGGLTPRHALTRAQVDGMLEAHAKATGLKWLKPQEALGDIVLDPQGGTTKAETCVALKRYMDLLLAYGTEQKQ